VRLLALVACSLPLACGADRSVAQHTVVQAPVEVTDHDGSVPESEPAITPPLDAPERSRPPSKASYEQAMSTPEALDIHDETPHLTDVQLTGPIRSALVGCRVPGNRRITIRTAVQYGRAIGVTVDVRVVRPKSARPLSRVAAREEAKTTATIAACVDHNVRALIWPPSRRRDSSTTEF
jgi:hypothetical protein